MIEIQAKHILIRNKAPEQWFDVAYNMNLYRGCSHGCIYCNSRSTCYQLEHYDEMEIKTNALALLRHELSSKRKVMTIGTGSMSDPYNPHEAERLYTRKALEILSEHGFPVHINTKSALITRDLDVLDDIHNSTMASVAVSFSTPNDALGAKLEPGVTSPSNRMQTLRKLRIRGIYCGILYMPVLPFITDTEEQVTDLLAQALDAGAQYILPWFGLSLREGSREYFYQALDAIDSTVTERYKKTFGNQYLCSSPQAPRLYDLVYNFCAKHSIACRMSEIETYERTIKANQLEIF